MLDQAGENQQRVVAQGLAEAEVVLQEAQDGGIEQDLLLGLFQAFKLIKRILALQQFGFAHGAKLTRIFIRQ
ncbi:MAG: hypothetical protein ILNGONEN_01185 [Syntrophorhabdaceae bacterium]|nr:hypothetical protein [Syntrophorhabdaceae bacterium]